MPSRSSGEGRESGHQPKDELSDVDALIAAVEAAANEAAVTAVRGEIVTTKGKKKTSAESVQRVEQLQQFFSGLQAEDRFVEDYAYEWAFNGLEAAVGVARPEKINDSIGALRKTGAALRKLAAVEPKSAVLSKKIVELEALHDRLFDQVQAATVEALDRVKKKYKGEESELEKHYKQLLESPLVRGVEQGPNTPEARETALKQEIVELLLRPVVTARLEPQERRLEEKKVRIAKIQKNYGEAKAAWSEAGWGHPNDSEAGSFARSNGLENTGTTTGINSAIGAEVEKCRKLEVQTQRDRLAFETNRLIIDKILGDEHDEKVLSEALVQLRGFFSVLNEKINRDNPMDWDDASRLKNPLAQKILGHYQQFGAVMPSSQRGDGANSLGIGEWSITEQMLGKEAYSSGKNGVVKGEQFLRNVALNRFLESRSPGLINLYFSGASVVTLENLLERYRATKSKIAYEKPSEKIAELLAEIPNEEVLIERFYSGEAEFINLHRAYQKVDAGLNTEKKPAAGPLPEALATAGWKESKQGAFVEPGQEARSVDREYSKLLERLSQPQVAAERIFDTVGPDREFIVYTLGQAEGLLHRASRDAGTILEETTRTRAEAEKKQAAAETEIKGLKSENAKLAAKMAADSQAAAARESGLTQELNTERTTVQTSQERVRVLEAELGKIKGVIDQLQGALKASAGMFGSKAELRATVTTAVETLRGVGSARS